MTKDEVINDLIDMMKNGVKNPLDAYCDTNPCSTCPFFQEDESGECAEAMVNELIYRLIKAEEHQETNLEHYVHCFHKDGINKGVVCGELYLVGEACELALKHYDLKEFVGWLLSPYEKPKLKLTQFEYDLLEIYVKEGCIGSIRDYWELDGMRSKGYFKGLPTDVPIKDILDNCEVID